MNTATHAVLEHCIQGSRSACTALAIFGPAKYTSPPGSKPVGSNHPQYGMLYYVACRFIVYIIHSMYMSAACMKLSAMPRALGWAQGHPPN